MKTVPVKVTYLQMLRPAEHNTQPPPEDVEINRAEKPTTEFYRFLYSSVGQGYGWVDRQLTSDEDLSKIIHDDLVEIHVLYVNGSPAGYAELDRRIEDEVELAYFGVMPEFAGKGLGRYLLDWTIAKAWSYGPKRLWLHTCRLDHPAALPLYLKAGFEAFDERVVDQVVL